MYKSVSIVLSLVIFSLNNLHVLSAQERPPTLTEEPWSEVVISVYDLDDAARFFNEIGNYSEIWRGAETEEFLTHLGLSDGTSAKSVILKAGNSEFGMIRLIKFEDVHQIPTRPGARPWDTGCFANLMVRAKGLENIYDDAIRMNWWTETPITDLKFGSSELKIVIFKGPQGMGVEAYERISPPLPEVFPDFERLSVPFLHNDDYT